MADRERLKQKVILDLLGNPVTLWPFVGGVAALLAAVVLPIDPAIPAFIGLTGIVGSMGGFALRMLYRRDVIFDRAAKELEDEESRAQLAAIDELYAKLRADGEPRTEQLLADLRSLTAMAHDDGTWPAITSSVKAAPAIEGRKRLNISHLQEKTERENRNGFFQTEGWAGRKVYYQSSP